MVFPVSLLILYFFYVLLNGQSPYRGALALLPYLVFFPLLVFAYSRRKMKKINWMDFTAFVVYLLPTLFIEVKPAGNLPFNGNDFESIFRISMILSAVYAFVTIRRLTDVGFYPVFNLKSLWTAIWVWFVFYLFVVIVGYNVNFIKFVGHDLIDNALLYKIVLTLIGTFFHTAIFEELFFRGILLNMLTKRDRVGLMPGMATGIIPESLFINKLKPTSHKTSR